MSAKDDLPSKQKGFQLGIDDYMVKSVELDELLLWYIGGWWQWGLLCLPEKR